MKTAIAGVWHVHVDSYATTAKAHGQVLGAWDPDAALLKDFCDRTGIPAFDSWEQLLQSEAEGIIVCAATNIHTELIVSAARAGKAIFTEKVLALTEAECDRISEAVEEAGVPFVISLFQKYLPGQRTVKRIADSGVLGRLNYVRFRNCHTGSISDWLPDRFYSAREGGGGAMIDLGAHGMYLIHWLLGLPEGYRSTFTLWDRNPRNRDRVEDNAVTVMTYADGTVAINETGFVSKGCPILLEVGGDRGYVIFDGTNVTLRTEKTETVEQEPELPAPIVQFLTGNILPGCGMEEAKALTRMMTGAYNNC